MQMSLEVNPLTCQSNLSKTLVTTFEDSTQGHTTAGIVAIARAISDLTQESELEL
jgi:predicted component of type VI protein secretion system